MTHDVINLIFKKHLAGAWLWTWIAGFKQPFCKSRGAWLHLGMVYHFLYIFAQRTDCFASWRFQVGWQPPMVTIAGGGQWTLEGRWEKSWRPDLRPETWFETLCLTWAGITCFESATTRWRRGVKTLASSPKLVKNEALSLENWIKCIVGPRESNFKRFKSQFQCRSQNQERRIQPYKKQAGSK